MIPFDAAHAAVHHPPDRRFRIWVRPSFLITAAGLMLLPVLAAWIELFLVGLPHIPAVPQVYPNNFAGPHGFPLWVRYCHFFNFLFVMMLIRSGLSILVGSSSPLLQQRLHSGQRMDSVYPNPSPRIGSGPRRMMRATSRP